jgi:hypothetical protein
MKRLLLKFLIFLSPFLIYCIIVVIIDPYNVIGYSKIISNDLKLNNAAIINESLWRVQLFKIKPSPNILFGDSRMAFKVDSLKNLTGEEYYNFACGSGNLPEMISSFWYAAKQIKLNKVYFGLNFELYNLSNSRDRISGSIAIADNPLLYFTNLNVLEASFQILKAKLTNSQTVVSSVPEMDKEKFWKYQIEMSGTRYFNNYVYPKDYFTKLSEVVNYCTQNNIKISFIILPTHIDLQKLISTYHLEENYNQYLSDLKSLGEVYDFNYENELTKIIDNFGDPFHVTASILDTLTKIIWGKNDINKCNFVRYSLNN